MSEVKLIRDNNTDVAFHPVEATESPYVRLYAEALRDINNPFAQFLKGLHGVSSTVKIGCASGIGSYWTIPEVEATDALQMLAQDNEYPRFRDRWARALTYRYRPLEEATPTNRADDTVREVIRQAENWVNILYEAMCNVESVYNKPTSIELSMFKSPSLDKKAVEAACRSILIALIHRCVIGFCGLRRASASREDKKLTCNERLHAIINALKYDKRICKDVMTEDSKVSLLVHAPLALSKLKKNQEKGNDIKRDLLAVGAAARRKAHSCSASLDTPIGATTHNPPPVSADNVLFRESLTPELPDPSPSITWPAPAHIPSTCSPSQALNVLSSSGFATLNQKSVSKKRSHAYTDKSGSEEAKCTRMKTYNEGSVVGATIEVTQPVRFELKDDDDNVYVETERTAPLPRFE